MAGILDKFRADSFSDQEERNRKKQEQLDSEYRQSNLESDDTQLRKFDEFMQGDQESLQSKMRRNQMPKQESTEPTTVMEKLNASISGGPQKRVTESEKNRAIDTATNEILDEYGLRKPEAMSNADFEEERRRIRTELRERLTGINKKEALLKAMQGMFQMYASAVHGVGPMDLKEPDLSSERSTEAKIAQMELDSLETQYKQGQINEREYRDRRSKLIDRIEKQRERDENAKIRKQERAADMEERRRYQEGKEADRERRRAEEKAEEARKKKLAAEDKQEIRRVERLADQAAKAIGMLSIEDEGDITDTDREKVSATLVALGAPPLEEHPGGIQGALQFLKDTRSDLEKRKYDVQDMPAEEIERGDSSSSTVQLSPEEKQKLVQALKARFGGK